MSTSESHQPEPHLPRESHMEATWPAFAGLALSLLGAAVLTGWLLDIALLKSILPGWVSMKPNAALGLVFSGAALWQLRTRASMKLPLRVGQLCATAGALIGLLTLTEYLAGLDLGIDNALFANAFSTIHTAHPGRIAANAASALLFGNLALLLLAGESNRRIRLTTAASLAILTLLLGLLGVAGNVHNSAAADALEGVTSMALHAALAFVLLGAAALSLAWAKVPWRWSLGTPVVVGLAVGILVLGGLGLESVRSTRKFVEMSRWVAHTQEVRSGIAELNAALATTLSSVGGYVMTGREAFLVQYAESDKRGNGAERRLRGLTADNPQQLARLDEIHALVAQRLAFFQRVIQTRRIGGMEPAASLIDTGRGQGLVDAIYDITKQMDREELRLLTIRQAEATILIRQASLVVPLGTLLTIGLFLSVLLYLNAEVDARQRASADVIKSEARFRSLVMATSQIVWTTDALGQVRTALPSWQAYTGQTDEDVKGSGWAHALHPADAEHAKAVWGSAVDARSLFDTEYRIRRKDGIYRDFSVRGVCVLDADGSIREWIGTCTDVTDSRKADADIRQLNAELDQRVAERTAQLEDANRELEAFSYSVSHDLRAPLRGVDSFSRMVIEDYGPKLDDEGRRMLNVVRSESQRMGQLIDDLLAFSRVGRVEMRSQWIDMGALVESVIDKLNVSPERRQQIRVAELPNAWGDRNLIEQVWVNLVTNALKFTSNEPAPAIEISGLLERGFEAYNVKDNGAGFDFRYVHKLFGVFQRLHTEEEFEGTGVGLALVQRIVHRHGGKVLAEGEVNRGAMFSFSLPVPEE